MPIEIKIFGESASQTLNELRDFTSGMLGFAAEPVTQTVSFGGAPFPPYKEAAEFISEAQAAATPDIIAEQQADVEQAKAATRRERGKPGEGRARRTKAEIAEDEAADKFDNENRSLGEHSGLGGDAAVQFGQNVVDAYEAQGISTGEERVSPDDVQDDADEADETASNSDGTLTHDDLRRALGTLGIKAGVAAVKEGGLLGMTVDKVPTDQIGAMIAKIEAAKADEGKTFVTNTARAGEEKDPRKEAAPTFPGTKDGLMKAMLAYAKKYDGTDVMGPNYMTEMPAMNTDCPKILGSALGAGFNSFSKVPADRYEEAVAAVATAIAGNPFDREVK